MVERMFVIMREITLRYGVTPIPCGVAFDSGWVLAGDLLFVSLDLSTSDLDALDRWLFDRLGPKLRLVASP